MGKVLDQILCRKTAEFGPKNFWRLVVTCSRSGRNVDQNVLRKKKSLEILRFQGFYGV